MRKTYLSQTVLFVSIAALGPLAFAQKDTGAEPVTGDQSVTEGESEILPGSLTKVIAESETFVTLTKAIKAAGLETTLGGKTEYTVFAPTDEAFGKMAPGTLDKLLLPENKEKLRMLLLYHVVAGRVTAAELDDGEVKTVNGESLAFLVAGKRIEVNGARVYSSDVVATNGLMHSIGEVLVPDSLDGFVGLEN
jgi:uncharacterized surface protein with fasciclin (FAS1) repeats